MKARIPAVLLIAAATLAVVSCPARAVTIERGFRTGLNVAKFRGEFDELVGFQSKLGFVGGGYLAFPVSPVLAFQTEAQYSSKGAKIEGQGTDPAGNPTAPTTTFVDLSYLELAPLVRLSLPTGGAVQPSLTFGPSLGIKLSGKVKTDYPGFPESSDLDNLKAVDFGGTVGIGARIGTGPVRFLAGLRYTTGFGDLYDLSGNLESINSVFSFTTGVSF